jgi:DNA-binding LacI/PurR family transcriptional regulator
LKQFENITEISPKAWSKQQPLSEALLTLARELGPEQRLPTVRQLCASFNVSTSTLDIALRELETRGMLVREHGRGIYTSSTIRQWTIGVVFGADIFQPGFSPFWSLLLQAIRAQAEENELRLFAYLNISQGHSGFGDHTQLMDDLAAGRLDGIYLLAPRYDDDEISYLRESGIPLVIHGGKGHDWHVKLDIIESVHLAVKVLTKRKCKKIAVLGHNVRECLPLFENLLNKTGRTEIIDWSYATWARNFPGIKYPEHLAYQLTLKMLSDRSNISLPDGIFSLDDTMTRGAIVALQQTHIRIGQDINIVSIANTGSPVLTLYSNQVVCLEYDPAHNVRAALNMLTTLIGGGTPAKNPFLVAPSIKENFS